MAIRTMGRRPLACHHEAGHALVRWYFGHRTDRAVVLTVEELRAGRRIRNRRGVLVESEGLIDAYDICAYPFGPIPVAGTARDQAESDRIRAVGRDIELIESFAGFRAEAVYRHASPAAAMLVGGLADMRRAWMLLDAWNLSGDERKRVMRSADRSATSLVRSPEGSLAIKAIADALMTRGSLTGNQIARLCRVAYGGRECAFGAWSDQWPPTLAQLRAGHIPARRAAA